VGDERTPEQNTRPGADPNRVIPLRRFTILDGVVMVVPLAVGFALARPFVRDFLSLLNSPDNTPLWLRRSGLVIGLASRFVAMGMLGLLVAGLLPRRPPLRRLSRQPGVVACAAAALAMAAGGWLVLFLSTFRTVHISSADAYRWPFFEARIMPAVAAAWVALAWGGRWRSEPSWVDRAGRALGAYWIGLFVFRSIVGWFWSTYWIQPR
jgi:hypothetical protein